MMAQSISTASRTRFAARPGRGAPPSLPTVAALAGFLTAVAGLLLPWVTVFRGMASLDGVAAGGGILGGIATASALVVVVAHRHGWPAGRWIALAGALVVVAGAIAAARAVADYASDPGAGGVLVAPTAGPGPWVLAAAGGLVAVAALWRVRPRASGTGLPARAGLAAAAFAAGWVHLLLAPGHWNESAVLGAGFIAAGVAQLVLAALIVERPSQPVYLALVALDVALVAVWAYAVLVGLPFAAAPGHADAGWAVGAGEPIDLTAALTKAAEISAAVWAGRLASKSVPS